MAMVSNVIYMSISCENNHEPTTIISELDVVYVTYKDCGTCHGGYLDNSVSLSTSTIGSMCICKWKKEITSKVVSDIMIGFQWVYFQNMFFFE